MSRTASFTPIEEAVYNLERKSVPWNVQFEVETTATIDVEALRDAAADACARHPLARGRRRPHDGWDGNYVWEIPERVADVPLEVVDGAGEDLSVIRRTFYGEPFDLTAEDPPFRLLVARGAGESGGDRLLLCHSHVAADGVGGMRLLRSMAAAYRGADPGTAAVDLSDSRAALDDVRPSSLAGRAARIGNAAGHLRHTVRPPSRITPEGGGDDLEWGFVHRRVDADLAARLVGDRPEGVSVNDVLLAALHLAIDRWNGERGDDPGKLSLMMPVNLRPAAWRYDVVGMYALFESVTTEPSHRRDPAATLERVAEQTAELKRPDRAAAFLESLELIPSGTPVALKQQLPELLRGPGKGLLDTAMLSNLGRIPAPLPGLDGEEPAAVWFTPPAWKPTPLGVGVATVGGTIHLGFRYLRTTFDADAAGAFASLYLECLDEAA